MMPMGRSRIRILVVDDQESMCETLEVLFERVGYEVHTCTGGQDAIRAIEEGPPFDLIVTDLVMPVVDGMEVLKASRRLNPEGQVIMITAHSTTEAAVSAMKLGAYDYIQKPFSLGEMRVTAEKALEKGRLVRENIALRRRVEGKTSFEDVIGRSEPIHQVIDTLTKVARLPTNVLIMGESGTGKELLARALHTASPRADRPFVVVDCGAIPETLMESELFGHTKGAFTGAVGTKTGLIKAASGGTLFLDEVGELPPSMQVKLLRAIQERTIKPVGSVETIPVDVRVVAATNRPLEDAIEKGEFRSDLYYRLNVIRVEIPPLRDRADDIPILCEHFVDRYNNAFGKMVQGLDEDALESLVHHPFPGNVRELSNIIERCVALETADRIRLETIRDGMSPENPVLPLARATRSEIGRQVADKGLDGVLGAFESSILERYWAQHGGNRKLIAERLGITLRSLRYRLSKYSIGPAGEEDEEELAPDDPASS
jgi:two-component system response regulator PilR (NtrC family)